MKPKRQRIIKEPVVIEAILVDPLTYVVNATTNNGRHDCTLNISYNVEIWYDQHVNIRQTEREGIDIDTLKDLANRSFKHIFYYQLRYQNIKILQYPERKGRDYRFILQEEREDGTLNITCELHFLDAGQYEMTFITAMVVDNFKVFDGQYVIKIDGEASKLFKMENNALISVADLL